MRLREFGVLRHDDHTLGIDDRSRKYHPIFKIVHGYCTQGKPSPGLRGQFYTKYDIYNYFYLS